MAQGMTLRLLDAGHGVRIFNRTPEKLVAVKDAGAYVARSPRDAVRHAEIVISMVSDDSASREVWCGADGVLSGHLPDAPLLIECSTLSHNWLLELASRAAELNLPFLDCPVTGLPEAARSGQLRLLAGGEDASVQAARKVLQHLGEVLHFGSVGLGNAFKLILNLMGTVQIAAVAEAMAAAKAAGIDLNLFFSAISGGVAASPQVMRIAANILADDHRSNIVFSATGRLKDARYGTQLMDFLHQPGVLAKTACDMFQSAVDAGNGASNESAIYLALTNRS